MTCDNCGKSGAEVRYMTRSYGKGASLLVIEDVPMVACPHCGESYLTAETLHESKGSSGIAQAWLSQGVLP